jgi:hypothetical protein
MRVVLELELTPLKLTSAVEAGELSTGVDLILSSFEEIRNAA